MTRYKSVLHGILTITLGMLPFVDGQNLPPDTEYVQVGSDGHLHLNGKRVRFGGAIGAFPGPEGKKGNNPYAAQDLLLQRIEDLGFNMIRLWHHDRAVRDQQDRYEKGDLSHLDRLDYFLTQMYKRGMRVWFAGNLAGGGAKPDDVNIINDPKTAEDWKAAITEMVRPNRRTGSTDVSLLTCPAILWDERLEALCKRNMEMLANHVNKHNGLRWGDDPVFAVWELTNEQWMMSKLVQGRWQTLPPFFRQGLFRRWHDFLTKKYGTTEKLKQAWGSLLPEEAIEKGTVLLAPLAKGVTAVALNDTNAEALAAISGGSNSYGPDDLPRARGEDVLEFFLDLLLSHKKRLAAHAKTLGKSLRLSLLLWDTGIGYEIQSQYLHQNADAVTHCAYINGWGERKEPPKGPFADPLEEQQRLLEWELSRPNRGGWISALEKPPALCKGVPWLEHNRVEGKPFFAYETMINSPAKYRTDYPLRLLALASIQDWDIVCWHTMAGKFDLINDPQPFNNPLDIANPEHKPQGYHYRFDEVLCAMIRAAGWAFRNFAYEPASQPTKFIYGRKSLYNPISMRYGGSYGLTGMNMLPTTYQCGVRIQIDPTREEDEVIGPVVQWNKMFTHNPYTPTSQIIFDHQKGFLQLDAPMGVMWSGFLAKYGKMLSFRNGVTLSDVQIVNPPGIYDPVKEDEQYFTFAMYSKDGRPLNESKMLALSLVSTSFNTGFELDPSGGYQHKRGDLPVLVVRVGGTIYAPFLHGLRYILRGWHMENLGEGKITGKEWILSPQLPVFTVELYRD